MTAQTALPVSARATASSRSGLTASPRMQWTLLKGGLVFADSAALAGAISLAYLIRFKTGVPFLSTPEHSLAFYSSVAYWVLPVWLAIFALYRVYDPRYLFRGFQEYIRAVNGCALGMAAVVFVSFVDERLIISRGWLLLVWGLSVLLVCGTRFVARRLLWGLRSRGYLVTRAVIVGANEEGRALGEQFTSDSRSGAQVVGFVDDALAPGAPVVAGRAVLGSVEELEQVIRDLGIGEVIVASTALTREGLLDLYRRLGRLEGVEIRLSSGLYEILTTGVTVQEISCVPLMTPQRIRITGVDAVLKAALDYAGAFLGLLALAPFLGAIALLVKLNSPGPAFYRRRVLGRNGRPFDAFKFRTMVVDAETVLAADTQLKEAFEKGYKLKEDPRVTRTGRFLRRTSLDELPQLINVLRGEMSLVGPRMIAPEEAERFGKWQMNLLTVKPGITGPWQVEGRSDIPYEERVRLSMHYIRNYSLWLDLGILLRTAPAVLRARGAY